MTYASGHLHIYNASNYRQSILIKSSQLMSAAYTPTYKYTYYITNISLLLIKYHIYKCCMHSLKYTNIASYIYIVSNLCHEVMITYITTSIKHYLFHLLTTNIYTKKYYIFYTNLLLKLSHVFRFLLKS